MFDSTVENAGGHSPTAGIHQRANLRCQPGRYHISSDEWTARIREYQEHRRWQALIRVERMDREDHR